MTLLELFVNCAYNIIYEQVGDSVNYAFVEQDHTLYIYFEGSNSITDWVLNFWFTKKAYGLFRVHRGFLHAYNQVRDIILNKIYDSNYYDKIVVVGYSHGGALCQLAIQDLVYHFPNLYIQGFAFETPRCIKVKKELKYYWGGLTTIRTNNDLITHLPPRLFGFTDLGTMVKTKGDTSLVDNHFPKCIKSHYPQVVISGLKEKNI